MIYELQTDTLTPRGMATVEERVEQALPVRTALSPLGACWRTEVGVLNQLISVWPYRDLAERDTVRAAEKTLGGWPPDIAGLVVERQSKIYQPAPFSPPLEPRKLGGVYEIRLYTCPPGGIPGMIEAWSEIIEERTRHSPLVAAWYSEEGPQPEWLHIWAYANAGERERIRESVTALGIWPPSVVDRRLQRKPRAVTTRMQNMLVVPTRFSPLC
jgi:hypothetical protein